MCSCVPHKWYLQWILQNRMAAANNPNYYAPRQDAHLVLANHTKIWDGLPAHDWDKSWNATFFASLGNIRIDGSTLAQTATATDIGSAGGVPNAAGATVAQLAQHAVRLQVLQQIILQYIQPDTEIYDVISTQFIGEGYAAYLYINQVGIGPKAIDVVKAKEMAKDWDLMTMENTVTCESLDENSVSKWANIVNQIGKRFQPAKTCAELRIKFLDGLDPVLSKTIGAQELTSPNPLYHFPALYAYPHPQAGNAHANAGQPSVSLIAKGFNLAWAKAIEVGDVRKHSKPTTVNQLESEDWTDETENAIDEDVSYAGRGKGKGKKGGGKGRGRGRDGRGRGGAKGDGGKKLAPHTTFTNCSDDYIAKFTCYRCGGLGHVSRWSDKDGHVYDCATPKAVAAKLKDEIQKHRESRKGKDVRQIDEPDEDSDVEGECDQEEDTLQMHLDNANIDYDGSSGSTSKSDSTSTKNFGRF